MFLFLCHSAVFFICWSDLLPFFKWLTQTNKLLIKVCGFKKNINKIDNGSKSVWTLVLDKKQIKKTDLLEVKTINESYPCCCCCVSDGPVWSVDPAPGGAAALIDGVDFCAWEACWISDGEQSVCKAQRHTAGSEEKNVCCQTVGPV